MTVEVSARLLRKGGVYLAGETVECEITAHNKASSTTDKNEKTDSIAWCSVQLHCQEVLNNQKIKVSRAAEQHRASNSQSEYTSFAPNRGENGFTVFATRPTILFCDLELLPGEIKTYKYSELLPTDDIPPSFKGQAVKYLYKLTVGVQHVRSSVKLLRLPFRVLVLTGLSHVCLDDNGLSPSNPFLHVEQNKASTLDIANQVIESITAIKNCHNYNITNEKGRVGTLTLYKNCFKLGEDILGRFDFSDADVPCVQCCVSLQTEEEISEEYRIKPDQKSIFTTYLRQHTVSLCHKESELKLTIPLNVTPTFFTDIVHLKWRLHFEFVTTTTELPSDTRNLSEDSSQGSAWVAPTDIQIETMVWDLPIKIYPLNPLNACLGSFDIDKIVSIEVLE